MMKSFFLFVSFVWLGFCASSQTARKTMKRLPDTGQNTSYTGTFGEDNDYTINAPFFTINGNGTVTDTVTGLMWQRTDGGEMTIENARIYCDTLTLGGFTDWRLPDAHEAFSILNQQYANPALDVSVFGNTGAEYWWTATVQYNDATKIWCTNAGGGIGNHPKSETIGAGGTKKFHVRAVRDVTTPVNIPSHFTDNGNGTITDNLTGLVWQKIPYSDTLTWEQALQYADTLSLAGPSDWRLPNIKELQSLNNEATANPSAFTAYFPATGAKRYWSSTSLPNQTTKAWYWDTQFGITTYDLKTLKHVVMCVRGGSDKTKISINETAIPAGVYEMGDHFGFVDPKHPSDELPLHQVKVNPLYMSVTETTNQQYLAFLNASLEKGLIEVRNNAVYAVGDTTLYCYTTQYASYYSIGFDGKSFYISDFRANHPMVGVMWFGAIAFCNELSRQMGLNECYNVKTGQCDFSKNGYRLPTEAEWEWAARGGHINPYYNYPWGNDVDNTKANWNSSNDPYEGTTVASYPNTTPVGFYNGSLRLKSQFNWPGAASSYQTGNGMNSFGLYDMAGNVWELINDWYGQDYYGVSPTDNPTGPVTGFIMPDGKAYRGMRGGNWYNGDTVNGVPEGHSRVSNRNPSYYRGPQDPNHPWYHIGFRFARNNPSGTGGIRNPQNSNMAGITGPEIYPNPFSGVTTIQFEVSEKQDIELNVYNACGQHVASLLHENLEPGIYQVKWDATEARPGMYYVELNTSTGLVFGKMMHR